MAEHTVRCWQCGSRVPERQAIRRNVRTGTVQDETLGGAGVYGRVDLCLGCDGNRQARRRLERALLWTILAIMFVAAVLATVLVVVATTTRGH